jgi:hypothetical protein
LDGGPFDGSTSGDGGGLDGGEPRCPRTPAPADRERRVVVTHPYVSAGVYSGRAAVYTLATTGELTATGATFEVSDRVLDGEIAFTPDGEIGIVALDDGNLGVFSLDDAGNPTVIDAAFDGSFYAAEVVMDPTGERAYVLDSQFRDIGGGIYEVEIGCDGRLTDRGRVAPSKLPYAMKLLSGGRALVAAKDILDEPEGDDLFLLDFPSATPSVVASADTFGADDAIVTELAVTADGRYALIGENNAFSGMPHRIAIARIDGTTLTPLEVRTGISDPQDLVASPFDDAVLVVSGVDGDALFYFPYDPSSASAPFGARQELTYVGGRPELPANAVLVDAGPLRGLVLVAENTAIRRVRFEGGGVVTDLGPTSTGSGIPAIVGAIGVAP